MNTLRLIIFALLLSFSGGAFAQQPDLENPDTVMDRIFQIEPDYIKESDTFEYQHRYLGSLFGTFIFQIWEGTNEASVTPLAYAIGFVNIIAMILAVITFLYVYILGAVGTASDASLMGKENSATMIPLRTATGFALLMPVPGIGGGVFSFIQLLVIWVIVTGSNAASVMWHSTVDYIKSNPESVLGTPSVDPSSPYDIAKMMLCSKITMDYFDESDAYLGDNFNFIEYEYSGTGYVGDMDYNDPKKLKGQSVSVEEDSILWVISTGTSISDIESTSFTKDAESEGIKKIKFINGNCGSVSLPYFDSSSVDDGALSNNIAYRKAIDNARFYMGTMMDEASEVALNMKQGSDINFTAIAEKYRTGEGGDVKEIAKYNNRLIQSGNDYMEFLTASINNTFNTLGKDENKKLAEKLKYGGWMNSILWFYERAVFSSAKATVYSQIDKAIEFKSPPSLCGDESLESLEDTSCYEFEQEMKFAMRTIDQMMLDANFSTEKARKKAAVACGFNSSCGSTNSMGSGDDIGDNVAMKIRASIAVLSFVSGGDVSDTSGRTNPFSLLSNLGHNLNLTAAGVWTTYGLIVSALSGGEAFFGGIASGGGFEGKIASFAYAAASVAKNFVAFALLTLAPMVLGILANGFILAYVIPFMPVLTWIAMLIGYLMMTIEAVIAAPLAVVMMFTPEGKGIVGTRLQSAINLINACTLRPMLMTLGVLAAIQLSYVAFEILNTFFWQVASNYLHGSFIDAFAVLIIYTTACFQICKIIVSTIPKLPDQIMSWMSSGVGRQFGEDTASSVEGAGGQLSKTAGEGVSGAQKAGDVIRNKGKSKPDSKA